MKHLLHRPSPISLTAMPNKTKVLLGLTMGLLLSGILIAAFSIGAVGSPAHSAVTTPSDSMTQPGSSDSQAVHGFAHIVKAVRPAVVNITASKAMDTGFSDGPDWFKPGPQDKQFFGMPPGPNPWQKPRGTGMGSGVIVSPEGYVVTNHHVVEGAKTVTVALLDKREFTGSIVGSDPQTDLAVIQIHGDDLPFIPWGDSSKLDVGDYVLAVGSPFGRVPRSRRAS